jgi:hypothetical protein
MNEELLNTILKLMRSGIESNVRFGVTLLLKNFKDDEIIDIFKKEAMSYLGNPKQRHNYPIFQYESGPGYGSSHFDSNEAGTIHIWKVQVVTYHERPPSGGQKYISGLIIITKNQKT